MAKSFGDFLKGFKSFGRSFNRSVIVNDEELHENFKAEFEHGRLQCNRIRATIVGEKGVGKTSLLDMLTGSRCDPSATVISTEGIDIAVCQTSDEDPTWRKVDSADVIRADDPVMCAAWNVCKKDSNFKGLFKSQPNNKTSKKHARGRSITDMDNHVDEKEHNDFKDSWTLTKKFWYFLKVNLILFMLVISGMHGGFGPFVWLVVMGYYVNSDFNSAYRFGAGCALVAILVDDISRDQQHLDTLPAIWHLPFLSPICVFCMKSILVCVLTLLWGFSCGIGCRSGLAIAFCLMVRPKIDSEPTCNQWEAAIPLCFGHLLGIFTLRRFMLIVSSKCTKKAELKYFFLLATVLVSVALIQLYTSKILLNLLLGLCMGFFPTWGAFKGREMVAAHLIKLHCVIKKTLGFLLATLTGRILGWHILSRNASLADIVISSTSALCFIAYDLSVCMKVNQLENQQLPIGTIRSCLMSQFRDNNPIGIKLHLWDYAGDSVYRDMQQSFLPPRAVYLLVFNLQDAFEDKEGQMISLRKWLHSIRSHSKINETLVFLVGTHRDTVAKKDPQFIDMLANYLVEHLYTTEFCSILGVTGKDKTLFVVENSKLIDEDGRLLRDAILQRVSGLPYFKERCSIAYLKVLGLIRQLFQTTIIATSCVWLLAIENGIDLSGIDLMLDYFHSTGEIIYNSEDEFMNKYIILEPQRLLDIIRGTLTIPRLSERGLQAEQWLRMEQTGEISAAFLEDIISENIDEPKLVPVIIRYLDRQHIIIPVTGQDGLEVSHYVISSLLPQACSSNEPRGLWENGPGDKEYFFDFDYAPAQAIFHRLLAKCSPGDSKAKLRNDQGRFKYHGNTYYFLQLKCLPTGQYLIRIIIRNSDKGILRWLTALLMDIRKKDFPNLRFTFGPLCQTCSIDGTCVKLLEVCSNDKRFPADNQFPIATFVDDRYHEVSLYPQLSVSCSKTRLMSMTSEESIDDNVVTDCYNKVSI